jgi:hypothetical protein
MRISAAFPSTYLKAADLQGRPVSVHMDRVTMEDLGSEEKPVLYFHGAQKGLVLNKTNANTIASVYGDDTTAWTGQPITLVESMVDYQGRSVAAIRVRMPAVARAPAPRAQVSRPPAATAFTPLAVPAIFGAPANGVFPGDIPMPPETVDGFDTPLDDEISF